jgi:hypothetical protein
MDCRHTNILFPYRMKERNRMEPHRYRVGQTVRFVKTASGSGIGGTPYGNFRIVGLLPDAQGRNQYRVESTSDRHHRVAVESEIALQ